MVKAADTVKKQWSGVLGWFRSKLTNGLMEGINSLIQAAKGRTRGFKTERSQNHDLFNRWEAGPPNHTVVSSPPHKIASTLKKLDLPSSKQSYSQLI